MDDKRALRAAMLINRTTANEGIPRLWTSPSVVALAQVAAARRPIYAAVVQIIHLDAAITHGTVDSLRNLAFPRLQRLVVDAVPNDIELALTSVTSLAELCILGPIRSPTVLAALDLMPANAATLTVVHLCCAITGAELVQLARLGHLERIALLGSLPPGAQMRKAAARIARAAKVAPVPLQPFPRLASIAVAATARGIFALLKLLADTCHASPADGAAATAARTHMSLEVSFSDVESVSLACLVKAFGGEEANSEGAGGGLSQAISLRPRLLLSTLRLKFLVARQLCREHIMELAKLPPTLRQLSLTTRDAAGHLATIRDLSALNIAQLVEPQTQLRSLHLEVLMPHIGVNALNCIGRLCRELRCLYVSGAFELDLLATCTCSRDLAVFPMGDDTRSALTSAYAVFGPPDPLKGCTDASREKPPLFPELRSLMLESTLPAGEGVPWATLMMAIRKARERGEDDIEHVKVQQSAKVNKEAAQRILAHIMRQAPQLEGLRLLHDREVSYFINRLWRKMHPNGLATCGLQHNCTHD
jgi:hypothetical protein